MLANSYFERTTVIRPATPLMSNLEERIASSSPGPDKLAGTKDNKANTTAKHPSVATHQQQL